MVLSNCGGYLNPLLALAWLSQQAVPALQTPTAESLEQVSWEIIDFLLVLVDVHDLRRGCFGQLAGDLLKGPALAHGNPLYDPSGCRQPLCSQLARRQHMASRRTSETVVPSASSAESFGFGRVTKVGGRSNSRDVNGFYRI